MQDTVKELNLCRETIFYGDYHIKWLDKTNKQKLKMIMSKFHFKQIIKGPTRVTENSRTLTDTVFTNEIDRITKTYNLLTGLSDRNMILTVRKLFKAPQHGSRVSV